METINDVWEDDEEEGCGEIIEGYYYARCPHCCKILVHGASGTDCFIKCPRCGRDTHIVISDNSVTIEPKRNCS